MSVAPKLPNEGHMILFTLSFIDTGWVNFPLIGGIGFTQRDFDIETRRLDHSISGIRSIPKGCDCL